MGFTTSYWQKERWSRRAADTLTSYGRCWNPSLGNWDVNWRVGDQDCVRTAMKNHIGNDKRARVVRWLIPKHQPRLEGSVWLLTRSVPPDLFQLTVVDDIIKQGAHTSSVHPNI